MEISFHGVRIAFHAAPSEHCSAIRCSVLLSSPATCQHYLFESMENLSEHRDRANKMDSNELGTTHPIHVWLREICQRWGNSPDYPRRRDPESTGGAALARGVANRDLTAPGCSGALRRENRSAATAQPPPANWSRATKVSSRDAQQMSSRELHEDLTRNSRVHSRVPPRQG